MTEKPKPCPWYTRLFGLARIDWGASCGRVYLTVNGYITAVQGDMNRDDNIGGAAWSARQIKAIAAGRQPETCNDAYRRWNTSKDTTDE